MQTHKALTLSFLMLSVALAGCTGGDEGLGIEVTPSADPVTEPYTFKAVGSADRFLWDFNDGTAVVEGREVEHLFGFTDGVITVRLTAETGGESETAETKVTLGTGQNGILKPVMEFSSDWVTPSDTIYFSGAKSTDPDNDPLLYRWTCSRMTDLKPATDSHGSSGAVPFGVQVAAAANAALSSAATIHDGDLCAALNGGDFTRQSSVAGSFAETGVYDVRMEVRDPKGAAFVGWAMVFVSSSVPEPVTTHNFTGTLYAPTGGDLQGTIEDAQDAGEEGGVPQDDPPSDLDKAEHVFTVPVPNRLVTITTEATSDTQTTPEVTYEIRSDSAVIVPPTTDSPKLIASGTFTNGREYTMVVSLTSGAAAEYTVTMVIENDLEPRHLYADPLDSH